MFIRPYPSPVALLLVFAFASFSCGSDGDADEGKVSVVQGPGSKSAEDEQARLDARLPGRLAEARVFHTATRLDDGRVMVTGGKGRVIKGAPSATAEIFDLAVGDWVLAAELPMARENHRAVLLRDGRVLITGGRGFIGVNLFQKLSETQDVRVLDNLRRFFENYVF